MKQRFGLLAAFIVLILILLGLNAATYVQQEKMPDQESFPNRSSYNSGATGTQAYYSLIAETRGNVSRWQNGFDRLRSTKTERLATLIVIGATRRPIEEIEYGQLLSWVSGGGNLVYIDRAVPLYLQNAITDWKIKTRFPDDVYTGSMDPSDQFAMTKDVAALKPIQPSLLTLGVTSVQPSKLASAISFSFASDETAESYTPEASPTEEPKDPHLRTVPAADLYGKGSAPVIYIENASGAVLSDIRYGAGKITFLSDPYMISNAGIGLVDNARLGLLIASSGDGPVAFDEYHQGFGGDQNRFIQYFAGTPVVALFLQLGVIVAVIMYSRSRRFARPVPVPEPDRLAKLEYVSAMAELQDRTRAYDLAVENIFSDLRRRASSLFGVDNKRTSRKDLAAFIAERTGRPAAEIEALMREAEAISHGEATNKEKTMDVVSKIRELEKELGLSRVRTRASH